MRLRSVASITSELRQVQEQFACSNFCTSGTTISRRTRIARSRSAKASTWRAFRCAGWDSCTPDPLIWTSCAPCVMRAAARCRWGWNRSDRVLSRINKGVTTAVIEQAVALVRRAGLRLHIFLMVGFPSETAPEMKSTLDFGLRLKPDSLLLSVTTPYPGTKLFDDLVARNTLREADWLAADTLSPESALIDTMTKEEFGN